MERKLDQIQNLTPCYVYSMIIKKYTYYIRYYSIALLLVVIHAIILGEKFKGIIFNLLCTIPQVLLLGQLGFNDATCYPYGYYVSGSWYLSTLFILFCIFFPLMNCNYHFFINNIAPILICVSLTSLIMDYGKVSVAFEPFTLGQAGLLRGGCELCIGCIICEISKLIKENVITKIAEVAMFTVVFLFMCMDINTLVEFPMLLITSIGILCIIVNNQRGVFVNNGIFLYLGRLSFPLLFLHEPIRALINIYINNKTVNRIAFYLLSCIASVLVMESVERLLNKIELRSCRYE